MSDYIKVNGRNYYWDTTDANAFIYYDKDSFHRYKHDAGDMWVSETGGCHKETYVDDVSYAGRIWHDVKVLSFWNFPPVELIPTIVRKLGVHFGIKIDESWKVSTHYDEPQQNWPSISEYLPGKDMDQPEWHMRSPLLKLGGFVPDGFGSKFQPKDAFPFECMAAYRYRKERKERFKKYRWA